MMGFFDEFKDELPPFLEYITYMYEKKVRVLVPGSQSKKIHFSDLREKVFTIDSENNKDSFEIIK